MKYEKPDGVVFVECIRGEWGYAINDGPLIAFGEHPERVMQVAMKCRSAKRFSNLMDKLSTPNPR